jgi:hypothetical protein
VSALATTLAQLRATLDAGRENLLALEASPTLRLLDATPLAGVTAAEWASAHQLRATLWSDATKLADLLDEVEGQRAKRTFDRAARDAELLERLEGTSILLAVDEVPIAERGLFGAAQSAQACTPRELLDAMSTRFERVRDVVARVAEVWDADVVRLGSRRADIEAAAAALDDPVTGVTLLTRVDTLAAAALTDPLAVAGDDLVALEGEIAALCRRADELADLRREFADHLDEARRNLAELAKLVDRATTTRAHTARRIVGPLPDAPSEREVARLDQQLESVRDLARRSRWNDAAIAFDRWHDDAAKLRVEADAAAAACRARLDTRGELRGRLDAYRALAAAHGRAEDPVADAARAEAERELYHAPCDLEAAAALLARYQRLLAAPTARESESEKEAS